MTGRPPDEAQMGRTLAETARLNSREAQAEDAARASVARESDPGDRADALARRNARIFIGAAALIVVFLALAVLLPGG